MPHLPPLGKPIFTRLFDIISNVSGHGRFLHKRALDALNLTGSEALLDVGCGTGSFLILAKQKHPNLKAFGIDPDKTSLHLAQQKSKSKNTELTLNQSTADSLPFPNQSFDVIVSTLAFHHIPTNKKIPSLQEINRVLKPNGRFLLADFGPIETPLQKTLLKIAKTLKMDEADLLDDNLKGKVPDMLISCGFSLSEPRPPYRDVHFWLCVP